MPTVIEPKEEEVLFPPIEKISRDLVKAAKELPLGQIRYMVDYYYQLQKMRTASMLRVYQADRKEEPEKEPSSALEWMFAQTMAMEKTIQRALDVWTDHQELGQWSKSIVGIGPVITAGLMAHIDITKAPTVGRIWSFAGLNPEVKWERNSRRPWNASLKTLCWKIGESFVKVQNKDKDVYGKLFVARKQYEWRRNLAGENEGAAETMLKVKDFKKDTQAKKWYSGYFDPEYIAEVLKQDSPNWLNLKPSTITPKPEWRMLPPGQINQRAKRWTVKIFLSHYHHVAYEIVMGQAPPKPYVFDHMGHADFLQPPNGTRRY
jgi:hypothetical protein